MRQPRLLSLHRYCSNPNRCDQPGANMARPSSRHDARISPGPGLVLRSHRFRPHLKPRCLVVVVTSRPRLVVMPLRQCKSAKVCIISLPWQLAIGRGLTRVDYTQTRSLGAGVRLGHECLGDDGGADSSSHTSGGWWPPGWFGRFVFEAGLMLLPSRPAN
ncbi:unnamed protein product [Protopolystoma xenopodis]|uniref:Uncharacterized protein n=1 Tax=Protopolystoma xenopodis TaxID=117903 RepID=A0A3S5B6P6_9PLAT|nr:unnamed protein product [Protopolystoma xenopodis]